MAAKLDGAELPVVDMAAFFAGQKDEGAMARATEAMREACRSYGFFRVVNHGVPSDLVDRALELSAAFFALPDEEKGKVRLPEGSKAPLPAGYARQPLHAVDMNEYLLFFHPQPPLDLPYPAESAGFREALEECHGKLTELGLLVQEILNDCMGLPRGFLAEYNGDRSFDFLAAVRYFPATAEDGSVGVAEHEDPNFITFVLQDGVGGLEVLKDGAWVPAEPVDGSIVVNIGDVVHVLSNGRLRSATHRVVTNPAVHRHSFAFFFTVHGDTWVEPLPEFTGDVGEAPRYSGFRYNEYQQLRMRNKTHPPARIEDAVNITYYAI